tara:strand:- start:1339 stop:3219 length:1881 start_codon:yes stop_codon:yes gene_type:complete
MANIRKAFNFRNGVQVDDDNLLVNPAGLVGVGTTVPTQALDVRGNAAVSGMLSATTAIFTDLEVNNLTTGSNNLALGIDKIIGAGVSIRSGIVTADLHLNPTGVVTYYGDGGELNNIPTSQWVDKDVGLGFTSIYNTGYVGVNTVDPRFSVQVGGNNDINNFAKGVGIASDGAIVATGIITAKTNFDGNLLGNIQGGIGTITQVLSTNANVTGIVTAGIGFTGDVRGNIVSGVSTITQVDSTNVSVSGVVTATTFKGEVEGDITGNVTGHVSGNIVGLAGTFTGDLEVNGGISGVSTVVTSKLTTTNSTLGISTASTFNVTEKLGVGVAIPVNNVDVFTTGDTKQTLVGSDSAALYLGQRVNTGIGESVSGIRFGSSLKTLEIINGDVGDVTTTIHGGVFSGINTGGFKWIYGKTTTTLMSLDYKGNLGINKAVPETALDVVGVTTLTGNTKIVGDLEITGTLTGAAAIPDLISGSQIYNNVGLSTFYELDVLQTLETGNIAIKTERANVAANVDIDAQRSRALFQSVGIGSTTPTQALDVVGTVKATTSQSVFLQVGDQGGAAIDFSNAGKNLDGIQANRSFMVLPKVTTTERGNLVGVTNGSIIYNTTTNKTQVWTGSAWVNLH